MRHDPLVRDHRDYDAGAVIDLEIHPVAPDRFGRKLESSKESLCIQEPPTHSAVKVELHQDANETSTTA
jgi:hypothetical protein